MMSKKLFGFGGSLLSLAIGLAFSCTVFADEMSGIEIMKKNYLAGKVKDYRSSSQFRLIAKDGRERKRETESVTKLKSGSTDSMRLVTFLVPADVKGTKTLMIENSDKDDDIWIYLPALKKVRRLVSSNKKDSFAGTDFSYGDVIGHKVADWSHKLLSDETIDGKTCYVIESKPKSRSVQEASGYSRRKSWIDKESFVLLKGEAYDNGGKLLKRFSGEKVKKVDAKSDKWIPMLVRAENIQTGHQTIIENIEFKPHVGLSDSLFSSRSLEK
jgi:outer membrane lipoprotein-sorting protein